MKKIKFYQYSKCSSCSKAHNFLKKAGANFESIPIVDQPPTLSELKTVLCAYDGQIRKLFNTSGMVYRELNLKDKIPSMSEQAALELLRQNGKLIKRPFVVIPGNTGIVGFKEQQWREFFSAD